MICNHEQSDPFCHNYGILGHVSCSKFTKNWLLTCWQVWTKTKRRSVLIACSILQVSVKSFTYQCWLANQQSLCLWVLPLRLLLRFHFHTPRRCSFPSWKVTGQHKLEVRGLIGPQEFGYLVGWCLGHRSAFRHKHKLRSSSRLGYWVTRRKALEKRGTLINWGRKVGLKGENSGSGDKEE